MTWPYEWIADGDQVRLYARRDHGGKIKTMIRRPFYTYVRNTRLDHMYVVQCRNYHEQAVGVMCRDLHHGGADFQPFADVETAIMALEMGFEFTEVP